MKRLTIVLLASLLLHAAQAAPLDCRNAPDQSTMNECADQGARAADARLNATYRRVLQRLASATPMRDQLVRAQRAWLAFRDQECAFTASGVEGGSIHPMILSGCLEDLASRRTRDLEAYLHCQDGDMSCPVPPK